MLQPCVACVEFHEGRRASPDKTENHATQYYQQPLV